MENTSSRGSDFADANHESTKIINGYNQEEGYAARFSNINPGSDGTFALTVSDGGSSRPPTFYVNAFGLRATLQDGGGYVTQIGFSSPEDGEKDVTEFLANETVYITVEDVDPGLDSSAKIQAKLLQGLIEATIELSLNGADGSFTGNVELSPFSVGKVNVEISGTVGTDQFLHRTSSISLQGE